MEGDVHVVSSLLVSDEKRHLVCRCGPYWETHHCQVRLWLDDPVLKLDKFDTTALSGRQGWWEGEQINCTLIATQKYGAMASIHYTCDRSETFRVRKWMQFSVGGSAFGVRMGEEVTTYATLHPDLYTPTKKKPYQGIWVGDYAGHGCEFLVVIQKDAVDIQVPEPSAAYGDMMDAETAWNAPERPENEDSLRVRVENVTNPSNPAADDGLHSGSLEAIKLTGDPNVPRGEYTFVADDIGPKGFIRVAEDEWFKGARIVKSRGHVAARGFTNDEFLPSQLILMSPNKLAQYWVPFGHISFYERVNIEQLIRS
ncbi:putative f-box domain protein [Phaeomoniella chlamydospora]|uniref:Putative f-box domain protein n=1 Tax=Phaeomoniella chlamydospora TaxID=158046 RepID=A0A0G2G282_PHACM|nr:putative f-box domain protein [Phaeomoniella chlamydospora]